MALATTLLTSSYDNVDRTAYTTASISPTANSVLYLFYVTRHATTAPDMTPSGVSGITWTKKASQVDGISLIGVYEGIVSGSPGTGALTLTMAGAVTAIGCHWHIIQVTGNDTVAPTVQQPLGATGSTGTASSLTFAAAGAAANRFISFHFHRAAEATTPRTNWTELDDVNGTTPNGATEVQWRNDGTNETTASASWVTSSRWQTVGVEVKAATGSAVALASTDANGTSTTTGNLIATFALAGQSDGVATDTGDMILSLALAATSDGLSSTTGDMILAIALAGSTDGTSTTTGDLTVTAFSGVALAGSTDGVSTATGALALSLPLVGGSDGTSTAAGDLGVTFALVGTSDGLSATAADLIVGATVALAGASDGASGASGDLTFALPEPIHRMIVVPSKRDKYGRPRAPYQVVRIQ